MDVSSCISWITSETEYFPDYLLITFPDYIMFTDHILSFLNRLSPPSAHTSRTSEWFACQYIRY